MRRVNTPPLFPLCALVPTFALFSHRKRLLHRRGYVRVLTVGFILHTHFVHQFGMDLIVWRGRLTAKSYL